MFVYFIVIIFVEIVIVFEVEVLTMVIAEASAGK